MKISETKFTAGPWHVEPVTDEDGQQFWSDDWNSKVFCVCHPRTECDASTVVPWINEGDARLIAAAPELYDVVKQLARRDPMYAKPHDRPLIQQARAALTKANGGAA